MIVVGDIAGQFDTLKELVEPYLGKEEIILAGDLVDRGPKSRDVVQFVIDNQEHVKAVKGNHEDMMIDWYLYHFGDDYKPVYDYDVWLDNGGYNTLLSYGKNRSEQIANMKEHITFLNNLPIKIEKGNVFISHAPWKPDALSFRDEIWHRGEPTKMEGKLQVFGHNSMWGLRTFNDKLNTYAICIDTSSSKILTGLQVDEDAEIKQIIQVNYR